MSAFDKIKSGLEEAIAYEQGTLPAKATTQTPNFPKKRELLCGDTAGRGGHGRRFMKM